MTSNQAKFLVRIHSIGAVLQSEKKVYVKVKFDGSFKEFKTSSIRDSNIVRVFPCLFCKPPPGNAARGYGLLELEYTSLQCICAGAR